MEISIIKALAYDNIGTGFVLSTRCPACGHNGTFEPTSPNDRGAAGSNLKDRISSLKNKIIVPQELIDGMDDLRLLGNDAAHVESQIFDDVGKEEVEIAIEFTKEILKAVYQYSTLLSKLKSLKKEATRL